MTRNSKKTQRMDGLVFQQRAQQMRFKHKVVTISKMMIDLVINNNIYKNNKNNKNKNKNI